MARHVGNLMIERLHALGRPPKWLAAECGVHLSSIYNWLGTGRISPAHLQTACEVLDMDYTAAAKLAFGIKQMPADWQDADSLTREEVRLVLAYRAASARGRMALEVMAATLARQERDLPGGAT